MDEDDTDHLPKLTDSVQSTPSAQLHAIFNVVTHNTEDIDAETSTSPQIFTQNNLEEQSSEQAGSGSMKDTQPHRVDKGKEKEDENLL